MTAKGTAVKMVSVFALALPLQAQAELMDLSSSVGELKQAFNEAKGDVRMLLLLSPG